MTVAEEMRVLAEEGLTLKGLTSGILGEIKRKAEQGDFKLVIGFADKWSLELLEQLKTDLVAQGFKVELYSDSGPTMKIHW